MTAEFIYPYIRITANSGVTKSEDAVNFDFLYRGGLYKDYKICIPAVNEAPNFYYYRGDGEEICVPVQHPESKG
jgi:hypothetical protein